MDSKPWLLYSAQSRFSELSPELRRVICGLRTVLPALVKANRCAEIRNDSFPIEYKFVWERLHLDIRFYLDTSGEASIFDIIEIA